MQWIPVGGAPMNEYRDQQWDHIVSNSADVSYWGEIGMASGGVWSWTILATNDAGDQWEAAFGRARTEADAKAAVEAWKP